MIERVSDAASSDGSMKLSILLPVRNEGINLRIMLKLLRALVDVPHEVLVVWDREDDDSAPVVRAMAEQYPELRGVCNTRGAGVLNALRTGVAESRGRYVLIFAADEVGPILAIEEMMSLMDEGCQFVSCTRYAHGGRRLGGSVIGGILSRAANSLLCRLTSLRLTDATTGIKMFTREVFERMDLQARPVGWAVTFEMAIKAQLSGLRLGEVPIVSIDRLYGGASTFSVGPWVAEYLKWFLWGLRQSWAGNMSAPPSVSVRTPAAMAMGGKAQVS
jgi:glycosyltransferase involved in cell wall biosynthesis